MTTFDDSLHMRTNDSLLVIADFNLSMTADDSLSVTANDSLLVTADISIHSSTLSSSQVSPSQLPRLTQGLFFK